MTNKVILFLLLFVLSFVLSVDAEFTMCQCQKQIIEWVEVKFDSYEEALKKFKSFEKEDFLLPNSYYWQVNLEVPTYFVAQIIYIPNYASDCVDVCVDGTNEEMVCTDICIDGQEKWIVLYPQVKCVDCVPIKE